MRIQRLQQEEEIRCFLDILPRVSEMMNLYLESPESQDAERAAHRILEMRKKDDVEEVRRRFLSLYNAVSEYTSGEEIASEMIEEYDRLKRRRSFLDFKIPFEIVAGIATAATGMIGGWQVGLFLLPFVLAGTYLVVKEDVEERKDLKWVGFFEKFWE